MLPFVTDEMVISLMFTKPNDDMPSASTNAPQAAPPAPGVADDGGTAVPSATAPSMEERVGSPELELWGTQRTRFLISKYKEWHTLVGKKGGFRQVSFAFPLKSYAQKVNLSFVSAFVDVSHMF